MYSTRGRMRLLPLLLAGVLLLLMVVPTSRAGPVGPMPSNVTGFDPKTTMADTCAVGDVVYMSGDEFPGASPCEKCRCEAGSVRCSRRCEPRPGCKAIHRPDQCCPTYQCECEQNGQVYANGEKLVDSAEPCRVCYCQGGEVVCRRIACFVRDDCKPRLVPGRCCPEYDNCPVRGVTAVTGNIPTVATISATEKIEETTSAAPIVKESPVKQEITIKEITPVSEIPSISGVKIMEILPSPSAEVVDYSSSKSPLIPREVSTEKTELNNKTEAIDTSSSSTVFEVTTIGNANNDASSTVESFPSKISLSISSENKNNLISSIAPSNIVNENAASTSTKASIIEEEDTSFFDHNPAFPPLPDDFSLLSNRGDEIVPEPSMENEHIPTVQEVSSSTESSLVSDSTSVSTDENIAKTFKEGTVAPTLVTKGSPMLNLRAAIPTEILNVPSTIVEDGDAETDDIEETTTTKIEDLATTSSVPTIEKQFKNLESTGVPSPVKVDSSPDISSSAKPDVPTTISQKIPSVYETAQEQTTSSIAKSNMATEIISQPEVTSAAIESSIATHQTIVPDQLSTNKIKEITTERVVRSTTEKYYTTTAEDPTTSETKILSTKANDLPSTINPESEQVTTDKSEIEVTTKHDVKAVETTGKNTNVLADLINLVGDVASISDQADEKSTPVSSSSDIPMSEELIHVNSGYKSKNNNWNLNSITEVPFKTKSSTTNTKSKVVEIESDDEENITDSPAPFDKVEPTTKRPIIDTVGENSDQSGNKTVKKEIEIITQSYVPTFNKRPTKVVMKKNSEKVEGIEMDSEAESPKVVSPTISNSGETSTDDYEVTETVERISKPDLASSTTA